MSRGDGDFLGRWSARKLKARDPEQETAVPESSAEPPPGPAPDLSGKTDEEVLEALGLPDPDTLAKGDDFSRFMQSAVPAAIRNRALRRLWLSDPVFANLDGLVDYGEDFTDAATVVKDLKTSYNILRGFLREEPKPEEVAAAEPDATPHSAAQDSAASQSEVSAGGESATSDAPDGESGAGDHAPTRETGSGPEDGRAPEADPRDSACRGGSEERVAAALDQPTRPRRMQFRFEG